MTTGIIPYQKDVLSEIVVSYSCNVPVNNRTQICSSKDAVTLFRKIWNNDTIEYQEQFCVLYLTRSNHVLGYHMHSTGGLSGTVVDTKQVLAIALKANAAAIILSHNHPSGNLRASQADEDLTRKIVRGAACLDLTVLDHIILTKDDYYSFADEGIMPCASDKNQYWAEEKE